MIDNCSDKASSVLPIGTLGKINLLYMNREVHTNSMSRPKSMSNGIKIFSFY